jgi:hypothetical protein
LRNAVHDANHLPPRIHKSKYKDDSKKEKKEKKARSKSRSRKNIFGLKSSPS